MYHFSNFTYVQGHREASGDLAPIPPMAFPPKPDSSNSETGAAAKNKAKKKKNKKKK